MNEARMKLLSYRKEALEKLENLKKQINVLEYKSQTEPGNWNLTGSMQHIKDELDNILDGFKN